MSAAPRPGPTAGKSKRAKPVASASKAGAADKAQPRTAPKARRSKPAATSAATPAAPARANASTRPAPRKRAKPAPTPRTSAAGPRISAPARAPASPAAPQRRGKASPHASAARASRQAARDAAPRAVPMDKVDPRVIAIVQRLEEAGHIARLVGGAVRDLLLGRTPKDFDLVTDARPEQIKRLFRNARIIGRRFRLVHLEYPDMTVEVSTFRAAAPRRADGRILRDNTFGTPEEDAFRRDFTVNALTCDLDEGQVQDYVGGVADVEARLIRTIAPPRVSLQEDPVRMVRAVRFVVRLEFQLEPALETTIRRMAGQLPTVKRHRLAEETQRFLTRGHAEAVFPDLHRLGLLEPLLGRSPFPWFFSGGDPLPLLRPYLRALDQWVGHDGGSVPPTVALLVLLLALARPEARTAMLGGWAGAPRRDSGAAAAAQRKLAARIPAMLGDWGLLKGQVEPALLILAAARGLAAPGQQPKSSRGDPPAGIREGWLLRVLLREGLGLGERIVKEARRAMAGLPVLPILDHQPGRKALGQRRSGRRPHRRRRDHRIRTAAPSDRPHPPRRRQG